MTRKRLIRNQLYNNDALYNLIQEEKCRTDETIHPVIRRWIESSVSTTRPSNIPISPNESDDDTDDEPVGPSNYPTTEDELRVRRGRRRQCKSNFLAFIIILLLFHSLLLYILLYIKTK